MNTLAKIFVPGGSFLFGMLLAFDFTGAVGEFRLVRDLAESSTRLNNLLNSINRDRMLSDAESLAEDWRRIGDDIRTAMAKVEHGQA